MNSPAYAELMKRPKALSARQETILRFVREYVGEHGYAPSYVEIMLRCNVSSLSVVFYNLRGLQKAGKLRLTPGESRTIVLTDGGPCPHCGSERA